MPADINSVAVCHHRCSSGSAHVDLVAPAPLSEQARVLLEPYIRVEPLKLDAVELATWRVRVPLTRETRPSGYERVDVTGKGDPPTYLWFQPEQREIVLDEPESSKMMVQTAVRFVRSLLRLSHASRQHLFLHAGMVACADWGVMILGAKRTGKTSSILAALLNGMTFVSNDDLSLYCSGKQWIGQGWPRSISVRTDTLAALGVSLTERLDSLGIQLQHPANVLPGRRASGDLQAVDNLLMYPHELTAIFEAPLATQASVVALVFPRFLERDSTEARLDKLSMDQAAQFLQENLLVSPAKYVGFLLPYFHLLDRDETLDLAHSVAAQIPAYRLDQGFRALDHGADCVRQLLVAAQTSFQRTIRKVTP